MHRAIAGAWFAGVGPVGTPVRTLHDAVSDGVYGSIRLGGRAVGMGLDARAIGSPEVTDTAQAAVNGLWGDDLGRHEGHLRIAMAIRDRSGAAVRIGPDSGGISGATGSVVVLVHGLMQTERCWRGRNGIPGLDEVLDGHPGLTSLAVRYNSGLHVSENGAQLAGLLERIHANWPVPVESIALVGHSMGGLVIRSACVSARSVGHHWIDVLHDVVTIGTPHRGAPLEKVTNVLAWGLGFASATQPLAESLNTRSAGIKDLRFGAIAEGDWRGADPDELLRDTVGDHPLPPDVEHHFIAGVVTSDPNHPVGVVAGDLMVRAVSGRGRQHVRPTNVAVLGGVRHFELLREPAVIEQVVGWVAPVSGAS